MKKILFSLCLIALLTGCAAKNENNNIGSEYMYTSVYIQTSSNYSWLYVNVEKWELHEDTGMISIWATNGRKYYTHSSNVVFEFRGEVK